MPVKVKLTREQKFLQDFKDHNRHMRSIGSAEMSYVRYVLYRKGKLKRVPNPVPVGVTTEISDHRSRYPSGMGVASVSGKKTQEYTGTYLIGVMPMHKSNLVPVTNPNHAKELSTMRRN